MVNAWIYVNNTRGVLIKKKKEARDVTAFKIIVLNLMINKQTDIPNLTLLN